MCLNTTQKFCTRSPRSLPCCITVNRGSLRNLIESFTQYMLTGGSPSASHTRIAFLPFSTTFIFGFCFIRGNPLGKFLSAKFEMKKVIWQYMYVKFLSRIIQYKYDIVWKKIISFVETLPSNWMKAGFDYGLPSEQLHESTVQHFILIKSYGNILITCERRVKI